MPNVHLPACLAAGPCTVRFKFNHQQILNICKHYFFTDLDGNNVTKFIDIQNYQVDENFTLVVNWQYDSTKLIGKTPQNMPQASIFCY